MIQMKWASRCCEASPKHAAKPLESAKCFYKQCYVNILFVCQRKWGFESCHVDMTFAAGAEDRVS